MGIVLVNDKGGITRPMEVWEEVGLKPGDEVAMWVENGNIIIAPHNQRQIVEPESPPQSYVHQLRGLHSEIWEGVDPDEYIREERDT